MALTCRWRSRPQHHERLLSNRSSAQPYLITASVIGRAAPVGGEAHSLAAFIFRRACAGSPVHGHGRGNLVHHSIIPRTEAPLRRFRLSAPDSIEIDQAALITAKMKITTTHSYQLVGERHWGCPAGANSRQLPTHTRYAELLPANVRSLIKSPPSFTLSACSLLDFWVGGGHFDHSSAREACNDAACSATRSRHDD